MARADVPSVDEMHELLSHPRARLVLQYFDQHANPVKLEDIAPAVARWEAGSGTAPDEETVEAVRDALAEKYLPWFADLGLAAYDESGRMVRYDAARITAAIEKVDESLKFVWSAVEGTGPPPTEADGDDDPATPD